MKFEQDYTNSIFRFFYFLFLKEYHLERKPGNIYFFLDFPACYLLNASYSMNRENMNRG